ncbi:MAG: VWA domain-containing protein [Anaerolineales bacterium]|nr:VWA domain-containing protein [Anaerolineales bacterium]
MKFLLPAGLGLLALAIPILLLYMLKLRRRQVQVSSTMLWSQLLRDRQANTPWQKLKRNLLMILQLLVLAALVFSFARPAVQTRTVASGSVIVLLDASASMNARDGNPTRFDSARQAVHSLIDDLSPGSAMTLILVTGRPHTLVAAQGDKPRLHSALNKAYPSQGPADWQAALALAAGANQNIEETTTVIVSDGGVSGSILPALPGEVRYLPVGSSRRNLAISAFALRLSMDGPQLFVEASNYSDQAAAVLLSIYLENILLTASQVEIPPGERHGLTLDDLPDQPGIYRAEISSPNPTTPLDDLLLDNTAHAIYQAASERRVLLVSEGNLFLEQLLASLPNLRPYRALPDENGALQIPTDPFDLYILDGVLPDPLPDGHLLFINPGSNAFFNVGAPFRELTDIQVNTHSLTRYLDWSSVHILQARTCQPPEWAEILIEADTWPLVFAGQAQDRRVAALTFDLHDSDLPLQVAFPILFSNLIDYLSPPGAFDASRSINPGESLTISLPADAERVVIASPSGQVYDHRPQSASLTFTQTGESGYYAVNFIRGDSHHSQYFAVNLFDAGESDIRPRQNLQLGTQSVSAPPSGQIGQRELWRWLAALALALLVIEWQVYHRRSLPGIRTLFPTGARPSSNRPRQEQRR